MNENVLYCCEVGSRKFKRLPIEIPETCLGNDNQNEHQYDEVIKQINQIHGDFEMFLNYILKGK